MSRVAHIMTTDVATIRDTATAGEAAREMYRLRLRHLPVVDGSGRLVGMLSDRDLRGPLLGTVREHSPLAPATPVAELMTRTVIVANPDDDLGVVARRIVEHRIGAVPIIDPTGVPVGVVSYVDVLRRLADEAEHDARAIELMDR